MLTGILSYFLFRKKYGEPEKYVRYNPAPKNHHITKAFSKAKRHVLDIEV